MVASDRLSAFDVVMAEAIPGKGRVLTQMALFWFERLKHIVPNHLTGRRPGERGRRRRARAGARPLDAGEEAAAPAGGSGRARLPRRQRLEGIRGHRIGLRRDAAAGSRDGLQAAGADLHAGDQGSDGRSRREHRLRAHERHRRPRPRGQGAATAIRLYAEAAEFALSKGIIVADTKFEFGLDEAGTLTLMDEVLTADSSRFWPAASYSEGSNPPSYDKQFVRDWLEAVRIDGRPWNKKAPAPPLTPEVIARTAERYEAALSALTR
jgi:phosphoribosylaminoimidazole-succinocarboxamide synthase